MACPIRFRYDVEKFVNAVAYFASKGVADLDRLKTAKLLYYADKFHLQRYGRPITGDTYNALPYGPIPSLSLDIMEEASLAEPSYFGLTDSNVDLFRDYLDINRESTYPTFTSKQSPDLDILSESEQEILDEVIDKYGHLPGPRLIDETHKETAWKRTPRNSEIDFRLLAEDLDEEHKKALIELLEHDQNYREAFDFG